MLTASQRLTGKHLASAAKRAQGLAAFKKLREIVAEDYGLDAEPPRTPALPRSR